MRSIGRVSSGSKSWPRFHIEDDFAIWLCTATDKQRDGLSRVNPHLEEVRSILLSAGFTPKQLTGLSTTAQSQETVERDYEGSWFYAVR